MRNKKPASRPSQDPQDDPFLESLFSAMCRNLSAVSDETFVDQVRDWLDAWHFTVSLKPRDQQEWLQAADVAMNQCFAVHSLVMREKKGTTAPQRMRHNQDFLAYAKAMRDARLRYDLLRRSRAK